MLINRDSMRMVKAYLFAQINANSRQSISHVPFIWLNGSACVCPDRLAAAVVIRTVVADVFADTCQNRGEPASVAVRQWFDRHALYRTCSARLAHRNLINPPRHYSCDTSALVMRSIPAACTRLMRPKQAETSHSASSIVTRCSATFRVEIQPLSHVGCRL